MIQISNNSRVHGVGYRGCEGKRIGAIAERSHLLKKIVQVKSLQLSISIPNFAGYYSSYPRTWQLVVRSSWDYRVNDTNWCTRLSPRLKHVTGPENVTGTLRSVNGTRKNDSLLPRIHNTCHVKEAIYSFVKTNWRNCTSAIGDQIGYSGYHQLYAGDTVKEKSNAPLQRY